MIKNKKAIISIALFGLLIGACTPERETQRDLLVIAVPSEDSPFRPKDRLSSRITVILDESQKLIVADKSGQIHELVGPFRGTLASVLDLPTPTLAGEQLWQAVEAYTSPTQNNQTVVPGATRGSEMAKVWQLDLDPANLPSVHCIPDAPTFRVSRQSLDNENAADVSFLANEQNPVLITFAENQRAAIIASGKFAQRTYSINVDGEFLMQTQMNVISTRDRRLLGNKLLESGCDKQFERYLVALNE